MKGVISGGIATKIITVGIGNQISEDELETIASEPDSQNVILSRSFFRLNRIEDEVLLEICGGR